MVRETPHLEMKRREPKNSSPEVALREHHPYEECVKEAVKRGENHRDDQEEEKFPDPDRPAEHHFGNKLCVIRTTLWKLLIVRTVDSHVCLSLIGSSCDSYQAYSALLRAAVTSSAVTCVMMARRLLLMLMWSALPCFAYNINPEKEELVPSGGRMEGSLYGFSVKNSQFLKTLSLTICQYLECNFDFLDNQVVAAAL